MNKEQSEIFVNKYKILEIRNGSHLYGYADENSDQDFVGLILAPKQYYLGLETLEHIDLSVFSKNEFGKNDKNAVDKIFYEWRKALKLIMEMNPNMCELIFPNKENIIYINSIGQRLLDNAFLFPNNMAKTKFCSYAISQKHKMITKPENHKDICQAIKWIEDIFFEVSDERTDQFNRTRIAEWLQELILSNIAIDNISHISIGSLNCCKTWTIKRLYSCLKQKADRVSSRSDFWSKYGYDVKFGCNLVRLMKTGKELLETGRIEFPLKERKLCKDIRDGKYTKEQILEMAEQFELELENVKSILPTTPNFDKINNFLIETIESCWQAKSNL